MGVFESLGGLLIAQVMGPLYVFDRPSFARLEVTKAYDAIGDSGATSLVDAVPHQQLVIEGRTSGDAPFLWKVIIDVENRVIERADWDTICPQTFNRRNWDFLAAVIGFPGIVVCSPVLIPWFLVRAVASAVSGMDTHHLVAWLKLRRQLTPEQAKMLVDAFRGESDERRWKAWSARIQQRKDKVAQTDANP